MPKLLLPLAFLFALVVGLAPATAEAGFVLEGSLGKGAQVRPSPVAAEPTNVMIAPGYELLGLLRLQLGMVAELGDVKNRDFDFQLRPMIGIYPPILPIYGRLIFAVQNLLGDGSTNVAVGGAVGIKIGIPLTGLGVFVEAGVLPRFVDSETQTVVEGRAGAYWAF